MFIRLKVFVQTVFHIFPPFWCSSNFPPSHHFPHSYIPVTLRSFRIHFVYWSYIFSIDKCTRRIRFNFITTTKGHFSYAYARLFRPSGTFHLTIQWYILFSREIICFSRAQKPRKVSDKCRVEYSVNASIISLVCVCVFFLSLPPASVMENWSVSKCSLFWR